jgi:phage tail tape-measure protein
MAQQLKIDIVAKDKSKQALTGVQSSLGKLKSAVFNLQNAFIGLGAGLVIRNLVNTGKQIEGLQVRLKFLFGNAREGAKAFDEMAKFASKVPFSLEEIQSGSGVLSVVSKDAEEI